MKSKSAAPRTIDDYISRFPPKVRAILKKVRETIRRAAPESVEAISYQMPAFKQDGVLVYFAAWKNHIGLYPPIRGDAALQQEAAKYANEKGNLLFPFDRPIPYTLIAKIVKLRVKQHAEKKEAMRSKRLKHEATKSTKRRSARGAGRLTMPT